MNDLASGHHVACFHDTDDQRIGVLASAVRMGLEQGDRILLLLAKNTAAASLTRLATMGIAVDPCVDRGQLVMRAVDPKPEEVVPLLEGEIAESAKAEYGALRVIGDLPGRNPERDDFCRVEAEINRFVQGKPCVLVCLYDLTTVPAPLRLSALQTHPWVAHKGEVYENPHYLAPELFLSDKRADASFDAALKGLTRTQKVKDAFAQMSSEMERMTEHVPPEPAPMQTPRPAAPAKAMEMSEALYLLAKFEHKWVTQYMELAHQMVIANPDLSEKFRDMSKKEEFHKRRIEDTIRYRLNDGGTRLADEATQHVFRARAPYTLADVPKLVDSGRKAMALALKMEQESVAIYDWILGLGFDGPMQDLCRSLKGMEEAQFKELKDQGGATVLLRKA